MNIACIGWGSLLWEPGALMLASGWQPGGPLLPLEFARDSDDSDELALVICAGAPSVPTFWAAMATPDLDVALDQLRRREKICAEHPEWAASVPAINGASGVSEGDDPRMAAWLASQPFDAVIWTALPPKFDNISGRVPSVEQALDLLSALRGSAREHAEEYVRRIPPAIMTPYRTRFERELGWTALPSTGSAASI